MMQTRAPSAARQSAAARPMPFEPPVTTAAAPSSPRSIGLPSPPCRHGRAHTTLESPRYLMPVRYVGWLGAAFLEQANRRHRLRELARDPSIESTDARHVGRDVPGRPQHRPDPSDLPPV